MADVVTVEIGNRIEDLAENPPSSLLVHERTQAFVGEVFHDDVADPFAGVEIYSAIFHNGFVEELADADESCLDILEMLVLHLDDFDCIGLPRLFVDATLDNPMCSLP